MTNESRMRMRRAGRIVDMTNELKRRMRTVERTVDTMTTDRIGCHPNPFARKRCKVRSSGHGGRQRRNQKFPDRLATFGMRV
jgi:hypothetical protein